MATKSCHFRLVDTETGPTRRTTGARTGGRSERVVAAVLGAAMAELGAVGYVALRLEDVAARAGVAKTTVYRRWPTKAALITAALDELGRYDDPLPDTGTLRGDILAVLEDAMSRVGTPEGLAIARMVTTERGVPEVDALVRQLKDKSRNHRAKIVLRAQERGQLPADADPHLILDCVFGVVFARLIRFGEKTDRPTCERLIDLVVTGAEHGGGRRTTRRTR